VSGVLAAPDASAATAALYRQGLFALELVAERSDTTTRPAGKPELAIVFRSLAALVGAGVPLERALAATHVLGGAALAPQLDRWRQALHEGTSLSTALSEPAGLIPPVVLGLIRAGERGSQLDLALEQVANHLEQEAELRSRVRQALAYPMLVAGAGVVSIGVITVLVLPKFAALLRDLGQQLPAATRLLLGFSSLIQQDWLSLLIGSSASVAGVAAWSRTPAGTAWWSRQLLAFPVLGELRMALATARLTRALGALLRTGLPILPALDAAAEAVGDATVSKRLRRARERVAGGEALSTAMQHESACSSSALPLLAVGEASGQLALMASRAGDLAAKDAERRLTTLVALLEPMLIVGFGGMVAFVAAALLQAVYSLRPG
jgi:type II secretory pathway component PulF